MICIQGIHHRCFHRFLRESPVSSADFHTRRQSQDIPLPRTRIRLIKIIDVQHVAAFAGAEHAEISDMRITAGLNHNACHRFRREIGCHHSRRAPVIGKRRFLHTGVTDREEFAHPVLFLFFQNLERLCSSLLHRPFREG